MTEAPTNLSSEPNLSNKEQAVTIYRIPRLVAPEHATHLESGVNELNHILGKFSIFARWINYYNQNPFTNNSGGSLPEEKTLASEENLQKIRELIKDRPSIYLAINSLDSNPSQIDSFLSNFNSRPGGDNNSIHFDVETETVESQEDLARYRRNLEIIIHDLRNPFTAINPRLQLFEMKKPTPELIEEYSHRYLAPQLKRMYRMLNSLPERLRNEYEPMTMTTEALNNLINEQLVKPLESKPFGIEISPLSISTEQGALNFTCNPDFLTELLGNNLQNFLRTGEGAKDPKRIIINLQMNPEEKTLSLVLSDTLGGFKPGVLDKDNKFTGQSGHGGRGKAMKYYQDLIELLFDGAKLEARDIYTPYPDNPEETQKGAEIKITMPLAA